MKILWVGDACIQSGFSTVTHNICDRLVKTLDLSVFGIGYNGKTKNTHSYYVFPAGDKYDLYSFSDINKVISSEGAEVVVLFNDLPIVVEYVKHIRGVFPKLPIASLIPINMLPLDTKLLTSMVTYGVNDVMVYTEFSKEQFGLVIPSVNISSTYHGVDKKIFYSEPQLKSSVGLKDVFTVGFVGTNSYRKRPDLFIEGFSKFAGGKNDVRAIIHTDNTNGDYLITDIAKYYDVADKIIISSGNVDNNKLRMIYNIMNVNVNTSTGEGFGLPLIEGAACGIPILCPAHGNLLDVWSSGATFINIAREEYVPKQNVRASIINTDDMANKLNKFYEDTNYLNEQSKLAFSRTNDNLFDWDVVTSKVYKSILQTAKSVVNLIQ